MSRSDGVSGRRRRRADGFGWDVISATVVVKGVVVERCAAGHLRYATATIVLGFPLSWVAKCSPRRPTPAVSEVHRNMNFIKPDASSVPLWCLASCLHHRTQCLNCCIQCSILATVSKSFYAMQHVVLPASQQVGISILPSYWASHDDCTKPLIKMDGSLFPFAS